MKPSHRTFGHLKLVKPGATRFAITLARLGGSQTLPFNLIGLPAISAVNQFRTSGTENRASLPAINVSGSTFTATLPHQSITTFTATLPPLKLGGARHHNGNCQHRTILSAEKVKPISHGYSSRLFFRRTTGVLLQLMASAAIVSAQDPAVDDFDRAALAANLSALSIAPHRSTTPHTEMKK